MSANSARSFRPTYELPDDYEVVILPDGTQVQRERQTKAQAKIQALKIKRRNEQLRQTLMSLSHAALKTAKQPITENSFKDTPEIHDQVNEIKNALQSDDQKSTTCSVSPNITKENEALNSEKVLNSNENEMTAIQKQMMAKLENRTDGPEHNGSNKTDSEKNSEFNISKLKKLIFR